MQKLKTKKGITLIALIITIILMLILVGVTVSVSLNGGLFNTAKQGADQTQLAGESEQLYSAAMGAVGEDGKVDFTKLDNNLPEIFTKVEERTYKSSVTGKTYMVSENGSITMIEEPKEGPLGLKVEIGTVSPVTLLISYEYEIPELTEETITEEQTISILAQAFNVSGGIESYEDLYLKVAQGLTGNAGLTYEQLLGATGKEEPTTQDVFLYLAEQAGFEGVETPQQAAIMALEMGTATYGGPEEIKLTINNEDKTELMINEAGKYLLSVGYVIPQYGEYEISLEVDEIKETKTIEVNEQTIQAIIGKWDTNKVDIRGEGISFVPIPKGFEVSTDENEDEVSEGLVIKDGENEFVWIPVATDFTPTYNHTENYTSYSEPTELTDVDTNSKADYDSQTTLNYYYGEGHFTYPQTAEEKANVNNTFAYSAHYAEMVESVNKYGGFYIGRYETTIDGNSIGSKAGATVLTADQSISQTNNNACRWWGLYDAQRNSNVAGNGSIVQTNMIWGQQWDAMITFFGSKDYSETSVSTLATSGKQNAGVAKYTNNGKQISDEICNIFDLRGNTFDWTAEANLTYRRGFRGGDYYGGNTASDRFYSIPYNDYDGLGSRLTLYIK